jgi:NAD(P)-dependent dehydrogenase (short-subunit alcohol dehydrogenase family)
MTTAVIGATGRVGSEIVRGVLARGEAITALVRDPGKARRAFGEPGGLHIRPTRLDDPRDLTEALDGIRTVFIAMGSIGMEGVLQRIAINAAAGISSIEQVTRLSVLSACRAGRRVPSRVPRRLRLIGASPSPDRLGSDHGCGSAELPATAGVRDQRRQRPDDPAPLLLPGLA